MANSEVEMEFLKVEIENVKSIKNFSLEIPIEQGLYAIAGTNGVGKSTIMALLAVPFRPALLNDLFGRCGNASKVNYFYEGKSDYWEKEGAGARWKVKGKSSKDIRIDGFIEGSIIHGTRFSDSTLESLQLSDSVSEEHLVVGFRLIDYSLRKQLRSFDLPPLHCCYRRFVV